MLVTLESAKVAEMPNFPAHFGWTVNKSKINPRQIQDIVLAMPTNKAPGIDKIRMPVIKDSLPAILPTLTSIINASFVTSTFPLPWKTAKVTPVPKEGDHEKPNNNRPVSLLPAFSKVCEKVALNQFMAFLESKHRPSTEQSGLIGN